MEKERGKEGRGREAAEDRLKDNGNKRIRERERGKEREDEEREGEREAKGVRKGQRKGKGWRG